MRGLSHQGSGCGMNRQPDAQQQGNENAAAGPSSCCQKQLSPCSHRCRYGGCGTRGGCGPGAAEGSCPANALRRWRPVQCLGDERPERRSGAASVVYGDCLYLFGGYGGHSRLDDLCKFDFVQRRWSKVKAANSPSARENNGAVVYRGCMYIFGGYSGIHWLQDLHAFDFEKEEWREIETGGQKPSARFGFVSALCGTEGLLYLYGGYDGTSWLRDMHELNLLSSQWAETRQHGHLPSGRSCPSWAHHENCIYMFGGYDGVNRLNDFFCFHIPTRCWTLIATHPPPTSPLSASPSSSSPYTFSSLRQDRAVSGGHVGASGRDSVDATRPSSPRSSRSSSRPAAWVEDSRGRASTSNVAGSVAFRGDEAERLSASGSGGRGASGGGAYGWYSQNASGASFGGGSSGGAGAVVFPQAGSGSGGVRESYEATDEGGVTCWRCTHSQIGAGVGEAFVCAPRDSCRSGTAGGGAVGAPSARYFHAAAAHGNCLYIFGGYNGQERLNDLYVFNLDTHEWQVVEARDTPSGRSSMVAQVYKNALYIFGGYNGHNVLNDFHEFKFPAVAIPPSTFIADLRRLLAPPDSDVTFVVEGGRLLHACKAILVARSEHFRALFQSGLKETEMAKNGVPISIGGVQYEVMAALLEYLHADMVSKRLSCQQIVQLMIAAERFCVDRLKCLCVEALRRMLSVTTVVEVLIAANDHNIVDLKEICLDYLLEHEEEVKDRNAMRPLVDHSALLYEVFMRSRRRRSPSGSRDSHSAHSPTGGGREGRAGSGGARDQLRGMDVRFMSCHGAHQGRGCSACGGGSCGDACEYRTHDR
ncbi:leucine zipper-like transcriptional regulator [Besnoitia besnoiti]|uniref:Leucine zipper-like transcriptional regulator n=1 Tax=Besnoitia besnoiti TaxID=94643 RepID=A0A2A9MH68_BESBE|nr:leucine zipper-like transcriptional regulator [Besnoitia besnoiti]PFH34937.1 leucine zipper-like transcriptional regulator [Besnoitia besnoiti]